MRLRDIIFALVSVLAMSLAFIATKIGLRTAPPLLLTALRFGCAAVPAVFFVRPPKTQVRHVALYGLLIGVGQFGFLFLAIGCGMPVGLASLVVQLQVFITIFLAWVVLGEQPSTVQGGAAMLALSGIVVIGAGRLEGARFWPFLMTVAAALCWSCGNIVGKRAGRINMFAFAIWSSLVAPLPLLALSMSFDGARTVYALTHPNWVLVLCVIWLAYGATILGYGLWSRLLAHYSAAAVAPFALLIPIVGMIAGRLIFAESVTPTEFCGVILVMAGLSFNVFGERIASRRLGLLRLRPLPPDRE